MQRKFSLREMCVNEKVMQVAAASRDAIELHVRLSEVVQTRIKYYSMISSGSEHKKYLLSLSTFIETGQLCVYFA